MTEKSPASSIHSTEPVMTSFDGGDVGPTASNVADAVTDSSAGDAGVTDASPASPAAEASVDLSKPPVIDENVAEVERLKLSTLKELTIVSSPVFTTLCPVVSQN